jgi:pimeloyl-ACP methyl ester carboxylesterase
LGIDVGGHRLHAVCCGSGSPVLLLESGIAASPLSWAVVQPEIAKFASVCACDRAGVAWSEAP